MASALAVTPDEEEEKSQRVAVGLPPEPATLPPPEPATLPPPEPQGLQYVNPMPPAQGVDPMAKPAPAPSPPPEKPEPVGGTLTPEQLAAATTIPAKPEGDNVDKLLAANPIPPKGPPPRPPVDLSSPQAIKSEQSRIYNEQTAAVDDAVAATQKVGQAKSEMALAESHAAEEQARVAEEFQKRQQAAIDQANARTQAYADRAAAERDKYMQMDLHDYWADKSTGNKILAGMAIIFGAAGRTSNEGNAGLNIINGAIERDFRLQQARIEKQKSNLMMAKEDYQDGLTQKQAALADLNILKAAAYDKTAAQLIAAKMKQGATLEQAQADKDVADLRARSAATQQDTLQSVHAQNIQDENLKIEKEKADAYAAKMLRGKGAGVGGASSDALAKLAQAAQNGASQADLMALGAKLGIPAKHLVDTVTKLQKDPEKLAEMQFTDMNGNVQTANSARAAKAAADQVAGAQAYKEAIEAYRDHIKQHGRILNPFSDDYKERERLQADVLARGRQAMGLGVSNANIELEHKAIGGSGTGLSRMSSPESLDKMVEEVDRVAAQRVKAAARPGQRFGPDATRVEPQGSAAAAPAAPKLDATKAAKLVKFVKDPKNANDPRLPAARSALQANGYMVQ